MFEIVPLSLVLLLIGEFVFVLVGTAELDWVVLLELFRGPLFVFVPFVVELLLVFAPFELELVPFPFPLVTVLPRTPLDVAPLLAFTAARAPLL